MQLFVGGGCKNLKWVFRMQLDCTPADRKYSFQESRKELKEWYHAPKPIFCKENMSWVCPRAISKGNFTHVQAYFAFLRAVNTTRILNICIWSQERARKTAFTGRAGNNLSDLPELLDCGTADVELDKNINSRGVRVCMSHRHVQYAACPTSCFRASASDNKFTLHHLSWC